MPDSLGKIAFDAYREARGGKNHDGSPTPTWEQVGDGVRDGWESSAAKVADSVIGAHFDIVAGARGLSFPMAVIAAKAGRRIARAGWNGKAMWVALTPGSTVPVGQARAGAASHRAAELISGAPDLYAAEGQKLTILPHLDMRAADGSLVIGWLASQTDLLAEDWMVLP